jgi:hypothetical protein
VFGPIKTLRDPIKAINIPQKGFDYELTMPGSRRDKQIERIYFSSGLEVDLLPLSFNLQLSRANSFYQKNETTLKNIVLFTSQQSSFCRTLILIDSSDSSEEAKSAESSRLLLRWSRTKVSSTGELRTVSLEFFEKFTSADQMDLCQRA